jgi:hypothetical protein
VARRNAGIRGARPASRGPRISPARLDALIEEAIVDAYNESEQVVGFHATIEQHLALPFETVVLGAPVIVKTVDIAESGHIVAIWISLFRAPAAIGLVRNLYANFGQFPPRNASGSPPDFAL